MGASSGVSKCFLAKSPVGSLPLANLEMPHCSGHFRAPAQMRSRCVGRGAARVLPREKVARRSRDGRSRLTTGASSRVSRRFPDDFLGSFKFKFAMANFF